MIKDAIEQMVSGGDLSTEQAEAVMRQIMCGKAKAAQIAAFVTALRMKGETVDELTGLARVMLEKAVPVEAGDDVVDTCGTGGDKSCSFNISTTAAFIAAGAGLKIAKHGNRAVTSRCGSADVLEKLGVNIELGAEGVAECLDKIGIGFMFAPHFHPAMKYAATTRRDIGIRTVFNILGPLVSPAHARFQVMGVAVQDLGEKLAQVLHRLGTEHALVVHGLNGMDEISISSKSVVWKVTPKGVSAPLEISPWDFGYKEADIEEIRGGTPQQNADMLRAVLEGESGPRREIAVINAAAAIVAGNLARGFEKAARLAEEAIDSGEALKKLQDLITLSKSLE